ncbi:2836_t:CDS:2, partial [Acaulospora colombiana]
GTDPILSLPSPVFVVSNVLFISSPPALTLAQENTIERPYLGLLIYQPSIILGDPVRQSNCPSFLPPLNPAIESRRRSESTDLPPDYDRQGARCQHKQERLGYVLCPNATTSHHSDGPSPSARSSRSTRRRNLVLHEEYLDVILLLRIAVKVVAPVIFHLTSLGPPPPLQGIARFLLPSYGISDRNASSH